MSDARIAIQNALDANPLREPLLRTVIRSLDLPRGSHGLDAGCGIGLQARLLADAVGTNGHVTGVDLSSEALVYGNVHVKDVGYADRITFCEGDVSCLPFEDDTFDWVWSADCVGYPLGELTPFLNELIRVVRPGGSLTILGWSSQQLLPGYPLLEARLNATCSGYVPYYKDQDPQLHFVRALGSFCQVGLQEVKAQTFVGDVQAPLSRGERVALLSLFEMLWGQRQPETSPEDWRDYQRLCEPASSDFVLDIPDYYGFFTYSMFQGTVPS